MKKDLVKISKFISFVLRHQPEKVGLTLAEGGWVTVDDLLKAAERSGVAFNRSVLEEVVATNDKQRFSFSPDGALIRANHGHSVDVPLNLVPSPPPETLFHGTVADSLAGIKKEGLQAKSRQYVHLSVERATAEMVGQRRGKPVILTVLTGAMAEAGYLFYHSASDIWLTAHVPVKYLVFPEDV